MVRVIVLEIDSHRDPRSDVSELSGSSNEGEGNRQA